MQTIKCIDTQVIQGWRVVEQEKSSSLAADVKDAIEEQKYDYAHGLLQEMIAIDLENPQAYNLLGIIYEKKGNRESAMKWYRVAYYIDQTYIAARKNLDRISCFGYRSVGEVEWGITEKEINK